MTDPEAEIDSLASIQDAELFEVSWTGTDNLSGIDTYELQYRANGGSWQTWIENTTDTSAQFSGSNAVQYDFRVRAQDIAGNQGSWSDTDSTVINLVSGHLTLSAAPSSLDFPSGVTSRPIDVEVTAAGSGSITLTSITEERTYPVWGTEEEDTDSVSRTLFSGLPETLSRTVEMSPYHRTKALGSSTQGSFTLTYTVEGIDSRGLTVSETIDIPVTVSEAQPSTLTIGSLSVEIPSGPSYEGEQIYGQIEIIASGSGTVQGEVTVDGQTSWTANPAFTANVQNTTTIDIPSPFPTTDLGTHTVRVELTSPQPLAAEAQYTVVSEGESPFTPDSIVLIPQTAELTDLIGDAVVTTNTNAGYEEYIFTGTATLNILSMGGIQLPAAEVQNLVIRYYDTDPGTAHILGGTVETEAPQTDPAGLFSAAGNHLVVRSVSFHGSPNLNTPTEYLTADTMLRWDELGRELFMIEEMKIGAAGIAAATYSPNDYFDLFGKRFAIEDSSGSPGLEIVRDDPNSRLGFVMAGELSWEEKTGTSTSTRTLSPFEGLTLYSDGTVDAELFLQPFDIITDKARVHRLSLSRDNGDLICTMAGSVSGIDFPLDNIVQDFTLTFDTDGNLIGDTEVVNEFTGNRGLQADNTDPSEWQHEIAVLDLTYLEPDFFFQQGGVLNKDVSALNIGVDVYFDLRGMGGDITPEERRIAFGEAGSSGDLENGIIVDCNGDVTWPAIDPALFENKIFDVTSSFSLKIETFALNTQASFLFNMGGQIIVDLPKVDGGAEFQDLEISLDGSVAKGSNEAIEGQFDLMDIVQITVGDVDWGGPDTIDFQTDETTGDGENRSLSKGTKQVEVESYFRLAGAEIQVGSIDEKGDGLISGQFDSMTVFKPVNGNKSFVLKNVEADFSEIKLKNTDIEYLSSFLRVSGSVKIVPKDITADLVGKCGTENNKPTMGLFVAVRGLEMNVYPNVFLDEVGGGFFYNPSQDDLALVRKIARFGEPAPTLVDGLDQMYPEGAGEPGSFALILLGGLYISDKDIMQGRAMFTLTSNYVELQAEVTALYDVLEGEAYLTISWDPGYALGYVKVDLDVLKILTGSGEIDFYVFSANTWGISGAYNIALLGQDVATGSLFLGPPGFMVSSKNQQSLDIGIVSGGFSMESMFWYHVKQGESNTWGAWGKSEIWGELLWGLVSGRAGLEGALIGAPRYVVYLVGHLRVEVCYVEVFNGSLWVSVGMDGIDGGKGRNEAYDSLIEEARNMASEMNAAKEDLEGQLSEAQLALVGLDEAQQQAAGAALVERAGIAGGLIELIFSYNELDYWGSGLPSPLRDIHTELFGPGQDELVEGRTELNSMRNTINNDVQSLQTYQEDVVTNLDGYQPLIVEELPSIEELGSLSNPFMGMQTQVVNVGGENREVTVGFRINEAREENQQDTLANVRESFSVYQEAFIEQAGIIDAKLQKIDGILFGDEDNLRFLNEHYADIYFRMGTFTDSFIRFMEENQSYAADALPLFEVSGIEDIIRGHLQTKAQELAAVNPNQLQNWNEDREDLIQVLIDQGGGEYVPPTETSGLTPEQVFVEQGMEIWYHIPKAGFQYSQNFSPSRQQQAISSFKTGSTDVIPAWGHATELADMVYDRKADLYDILWEIYDQLANYGSGRIAVTGEGNAAGFSGLSAQGLSFRGSDIADAIQNQSSPLPEHAAQPEGPTVGPHNPLVPEQSESINEIFQGGGYQDGTIQGGQFQGGGTYGPFMMEPGIEALPGVQLASALPRFGLTGRILPPLFPLQREHIQYSGEEPPEINPNIPPEALGLTEGDEEGSTNWVPITTYFTGKREEIEPYLEIPVISTVDGTVTSEFDMSAALSAQIDGEHPVGVVEYAFRLTSAPVEELPPDPPLYPWSSPNLTAGGVQPAGFATPWLSLGSKDSVNYPFFDAGGNIYLYFRARGAGGKTIARRGSVTVDYFDQAEGPFTADLDSEDSTPPGAPIVTLSGKFTSRTDIIFAEWEAGDPESGIAGYEYAVSTYSGPGPDLNTGGAEFEGSVNQDTVFGSTGEPPADLQSGTTSTVDYFTMTGDAGGVDTLAELDTPPDIVPWTAAEGRTSVNIRSLELEHGQSYIVHVRATNGVGMRNIGTSDPIFVDTTKPEEPAVTSAVQTTADGHPNSISFAFSPGSDPESGITRHLIALGTTETGTDLLNWTELSKADGIIADIPVMDGNEVFLSVQAENGSGLANSQSVPVLFTFNDTSPPPEAEVFSSPQFFASDTTEVIVGWDPVADGESGIIGYQYGIGTSQNDADVVLWTSIDKKAKPYLIGQTSAGSGNGPGNTGSKNGPGSRGATSETDRTGEDDFQFSSPDKGDRQRGGTGRGDTGFDFTIVTEIQTDYSGLFGSQYGSGSVYSVAIPSPPLEHGESYYIVVKTINGSGMSTISASEPLTIDETPPEIIDFSADEEQSSKTKLTVELDARDNQSGIDAVRYRVWDWGDMAKGPLPGAETNGQNDVPVQLVMGFTTDGMFQGTYELPGQTTEQFTEPPSSGATSPGSQFEWQGGSPLTPGLIQDITELTDPWMVSPWQGVSSGALPQTANLTLNITGFPRQLQYNHRYIVKVEVKNGAGDIVESDTITITVVKQSGKRSSSGKPGNQQLRSF